MVSLRPNTIILIQKRRPLLYTPLLSQSPHLASKTSWNNPEHPDLCIHLFIPPIIFALFTIWEEVNRPIVLQPVYLNPSSTLANFCSHAVPLRGESWNEKPCPSFSPPLLPPAAIILPSSSPLQKQPIMVGTGGCLSIFLPKERHEKWRVSEVEWENGTNSELIILDYACHHQVGGSN